MLSFSVIKPTEVFIVNNCNDKLTNKRDRQSESTAYIVADLPGQRDETHALI